VSIEQEKGAEQGHAMLVESWLDSANAEGCPFPVNNLALGVFSVGEDLPCCGVAIGDMIFNCRSACQAGLLQPENCRLFDAPSWNAVMEAGPAIWRDLRLQLTELFVKGCKNQAEVREHLVPISDATLHMPFRVAEFTDFYAGRHHATNVGTMFRGAENALPPNWLHIPIGYNGRASSVVVSGAGVRRPWGQLKSPDHEKPAFLPSRRFDFELEMGAIVGTPSTGPVSVDEADSMIFGYVLLNDWSARDIQAWEYQPLGPFQAKASATSISPWIIMAEALEPFRVMTPEREFELLPHLKDTGPMLYDVDLRVDLATSEGSVQTITQTNYREMYYSAAQQLAHHASSGCPMRAGDLLGSGTISGPEKHQRGSMLELSWGGKEPIKLLAGRKRTFLEDGDTVILTGEARGKDYIIGFGECAGQLLPALKEPYGKQD
jgi:fumarylacetoacetase